MFESAESNQLRMYAQRVLGEQTQIQLTRTRYGAFAEFRSGTAYFGAPGATPKEAIDAAYTCWRRYAYLERNK